MRSPSPFPKPIYVTQPMLPSRRQVFAAFRQIWHSAWFTNEGAFHRKLEARLKHYLRVCQLSLFNNGSIALMIACKAAKLSGEVLTTPLTFAVTPHVLIWNQLRPVFCDVDPQTLNLAPERIEAAITSRTSGILATHLYGNPCDVQALDQIARRHGLKVIYDGAHAFGVNVHGRGIGSYGDFTAFSFHATKLFHTAEGGALSCRSKTMKLQVDLLRNFGIENEEKVVLPGINGKMNELQAVLGLCNLDRLDAERNRRSALQTIYCEHLSDLSGLTWVTAPLKDRSALQYMVVRIDAEKFGISRDELHRRLKRYNIITRKYFYPLCSDYPFYRKLPSSRSENLPVAHRAAQEVLCLPFHGSLNPESVRKICDIIRSIRKSL